MKDLFFDEDEHKYYYKGVRVPCASDVLKTIDSIALDGIPPKNLFLAAERGKRIHEATEDYDCGLLEIDDDWLVENMDIEPYVTAYIKFATDYPSLPFASEESLYSERTGVAGTTDLVKEIDGKLALIDKKTTTTVGTLRNKIQLNLYRVNWNETHDRKIEAIYILHLKSDGTYRLIPFDIDEEIVAKWVGIYNEIKGDKKI